MDVSQLKQLILYSKTLEVLYIEDSKESREQSLKLMENFFSNITVAVNGKDGLDLFLNNSFDLIISDLNMPIMHGTEMIEKIRLEDKTIPIIVTTAHNEKTFKNDATKFNITEYLIKPLNVDMFFRVIEKLKEV